MLKSRLIYFLSAFLTLAVCLSSCTYDYFEDETNYQIYVPEVADGTVDNCRVLVYDADGNLVGERWTRLPAEDPRMAEGLFSFTLPPGDYKVYVVANADSLDLENLPLLPSASVNIPKVPGGSNPSDPSDPSSVTEYPQPNGDLGYQEIDHIVDHYGEIRTDTTSIMPIPGQITIRFISFDIDVTTIASAKVTVTGTGTKYLLSGGNSAALTPGDAVVHTYSPITLGDSDDVKMIFDGYYFPSLPGELIEFHFEFFDENGVKIKDRYVTINDEKGNPLSLSAGEHLQIDVAEEGISIELVPWNPVVKPGTPIQDFPTASDRE